MQNLSRRQFVGAAATGAAVTAAGCTGGILGDGDGDDPVYGDWLAAELIGTVDDGMIMYIDLRRIHDEWPAAAHEEFDLEELAADFYVEPADLGGMLIIEEGSGFDVESNLVLLGSFDAEPIVEDIEADMEEFGMDPDRESYGEYDVLAGEAAIGDEAIVFGRGHEALIDAHEGDADRIGDVDDDWASVLNDVGGAAISSVVLDPNADFELVGLAMDEDDGDVHVVAYGYFEDEDAAESGREEVEAEVESEFDGGDGEIASVEVDGNVVVVEAVIADFEW